jgi:LuxR family maltose regulon positive regulatory protein
METSLLKTKLTPPPLRPYLVSRPGLLETLERCPHFDLTLVSAPAGFGKTTILSQWVYKNISALPIAWLSLDKSDDDPVRFWLYFTGALRAALETQGSEYIIDSLFCCSTGLCFSAFPFPGLRISIIPWTGD